MNRPTESAPGGMSGSARMHDPSEAEHDGSGRRAMNLAFLLIVLINAADCYWVGLHGWDWLRALLLVVAAVPAGLVIKVVELRFKMSGTEWWRVMREMPRVKYLCYFILLGLALVVLPHLSTWALLGVWFYDFVTYYHDRPERMRHLYAVTLTLDEIGEFRAPWAWALPATIAAAYALTTVTPSP